MLEYVLHRPSASFNHPPTSLAVRELQAMKRPHRLRGSAQVHIHPPGVGVELIARRWVAPSLANARQEVLWIVRRVAAVTSSGAQGANGSVVEARKHERGEHVGG